LETPYALQNSISAIKAAIELSPVFIEFDIVFDPLTKRAMTSHPPQKPLDELELILQSFKGKKTFPKLDLKLKEETYKEFIKIIIKHINDFGTYVLVNLSGFHGEKMMKIEEYFASKIKDLDFVQINIDLARYRKSNQLLNEKILKHIEQIKEKIGGISPEINEENWELVAELAEKFGIQKIYFWLRGWPDVKYPIIKQEMIFKALELEKKYKIQVFFDINMNYVHK